MDIYLMQSFQENLIKNPLFIVGLLLISGFTLGKIFSKIKIPEVSGFIIAGIALNSFTTGVVSRDMKSFLHVIAEIAIGFLALSIGSEFAIKKIKRIAKEIFAITAFQMSLTVILVTGGLYLLGLDFPFALLLGVSACATSPALIVAEVHHLKAHGRFIDYLFGTIALVDAFSVVIFGIALTFVINHLGVEVQSFSIIWVSLREILLSVVIGFFGGILVHAITAKTKSEQELLIIAIGFIFLTTGLSLALHLSPLLLNMMTGAVLVNLSIKNHRIFKVIEPLTPPIYAMFFIIAGLELDPSILFQRNILLFAIGYFVLRIAGKYIGTYAGCSIHNVAPPIKKYLGLSMFSQAGVALGFVLLIQTSPLLTSFEATSETHMMFSKMMKIVLLSIFLNELMSPIFTKLSILKGNEMEE